MNGERDAQLTQILKSVNDILDRSLSRTARGELEVANRMRNALIAAGVIMADYCSVLDLPDPKERQSWVRAAFCFMEYDK